jgi:predicted transcriptional regulator
VTKYDVVVRGVNSKIIKKEERSDKKVTKIWLSMFGPIPHSKVVNCGVLKAVSFLLTLIMFG